MSAPLRSGWLPAALSLAVTAALLVGTGVTWVQCLVFAAYLVLGLVLPGVLLLRLVRPRAERLWLEDVVLGTVLGYAVEIATYLPARAAGAPLLVLAWPLGVYAVATLTRRGRATWRSAQTSRTPLSWAWTLSGLVTYLVLFVARANWVETGLSAQQLRVIGPDASFQLALTGELRHHVPSTFPWVDAEPLVYHWFLYVHTAASSWLTALEPVLLLRRLAPLPMMVLVVVATALIGARLAGRLSVGPWAAGLLVLVASPAFFAPGTDHFQREEFTSAALYGSPTMTFGLVFLCGVLLVLPEILDGPPTASSWALLALFTAAASGAKATIAPMLVAGAVAVVAVGLLTRTLRRRHTTLLALVLTSWLLFQLVFYGGQGNGVRLTAGGTLEVMADAIGARTPTPVSLAGVLFAVVVVVLWSVHLAGMAGLLVRGGWRSPSTVFWVGFVLSGLGAGLLFAIPEFSQQWFVCSTQVAAAAGAAAGFARLVPAAHRRELSTLAATAVLLVTIGLAAAWSWGPASLPATGPPLERLWDYAGGFVVVLLVLGLVAGGVALLHTRAPTATAVAVFVCAGLTGLGAFRTVQVLGGLAQAPWPDPVAPAPADTAVGESGVEAARWLRAHSGTDDVLAVNAHTWTPGSTLLVSSWLSGYAERRVLVEGWGYTRRHSTIEVRDGLAFDDVPYWDQAQLRANDAAFTAPSPSALRAVGAYGVDWLVLDRRFPGEGDALGALLEPVFDDGDYAVYRMPEAAGRG